MTYQYTHIEAESLMVAVYLKQKSAGENTIDSKIKLLFMLKPEWFNSRISNLSTLARVARSTNKKIKQPFFNSYPERISIFKTKNVYNDVVVVA